MDFNSLKDAVTNLTLYDLKAGVRKVQNGTRVGVLGFVQLECTDVLCFLAVMNFTEMEAKVCSNGRNSHDLTRR